MNQTKNKKKNECLFEAQHLNKRARFFSKIFSPPLMSEEWTNVIFLQFHKTTFHLWARNSDGPIHFSTGWFSSQISKTCRGNEKIHSIPPGVNFTKILQAAFLYKSVFRSFSLITLWLCNFSLKENWLKIKSCS